jgi:short subunit dehydrogenase-like uncharacterized protein
MGGRNADKLAAVRDEVGAPADTPLVVTDSADPASLQALMAPDPPGADHRGPLPAVWQRTGGRLRRQRRGLCGPVRRAGLDAPDDRRARSQAKASGARIVFSCGFDSIPFDLGVFMLQNEMPSASATPASRVRGRVRKMKGTFSGGTAASLKATMAAAATNPGVLDLLRNPFSLTPGFEGPRQPSGTSPWWTRRWGLWVAPFVMAAINTRNVHRSNFLLGHAYGADFVYDEMLVTGPGEKGEAIANAVAADKSLGPRAAPSPAKAPRARSARPASTTCCSSAPTPPATSLRVGVKGDRDPGYGSTSKMIAEAAVCLLQDAPARPAASGPRPPPWASA